MSRRRASLDRVTPKTRILPSLCLLAGLSFGCGDDSDDVEADRVGVGAACVNNSECKEFQEESETGEPALECLPQFTGGYCGLSDCAANEDCPEGSACVAHTDGTNYCFRMCIDKAECNENRPPDAESNCSANITFVEPGTPGKACVPPSSGL